MPIRILFLFSEPALYFFKCVSLLSRVDNVQCRVYHYRTSHSAPYLLNCHDFEVICKDDMKADQLYRDAVNFKPHIIYIGGWSDAVYRRLAKYFKKHKRIVICGMDNAWRATLRQIILRIVSPVSIKTMFTHFWVPGLRQYQFALNLGYSPSQILKGLLSADISIFCDDHCAARQKEMLFVGRLEKEKGLLNLVHVFNSLSSTERNNWTLTLIGNGSLTDQLTGPNVTVLPFMQPVDVANRMCQAGFFILPSAFEPWGVVVHEAVCCGMPLVLSNCVNAGEEYLIHGFNGYTFKFDDRQDLRGVLKAAFSLSSEELSEMRTRSQLLAKRYTPEIWAAQLLSLLPDNRNRSSFFRTR